MESTLVYTQLVNFKTEEYHWAVAYNVEEARRLIEQGFEFVCEVDGVHVSENASSPSTVNWKNGIVNFLTMHIQ